MTQLISFFKNYLSPRNIYTVTSFSIYDKYAYRRQKRLLEIFIVITTLSLAASSIYESYILRLDSFTLPVFIYITAGAFFILLSRLNFYYIALWGVILFFNTAIYIHFVDSLAAVDLYFLIVPFLVVCIHFTLVYLFAYLILINVITLGIIFHFAELGPDIIRFQFWFLAVSSFLGLLFLYLNQLSVLRHNRLQETLQATIFGLASEAELRDRDTGEHLERTKRYVFLLTSELSKIDKYMPYLTLRYCHDIALAAVLHDVGKVGISDSILLKPGKLNNEEFEIIKQHPVFGAQLIDGLMKRLSFETFFSIARQLALYHHEKWDGSGYPEGLSGESIPLSARIMALCDVYDALRSDRPYKSAMMHDDAVSIIKEMRGKHFDPDIVDIFLKIQDEFLHISTDQTVS